MLPTDSLIAFLTSFLITTFLVPVALYLVSSTSKIIKVEHKSTYKMKITEKWGSM